MTSGLRAGTVLAHGIGRAAVPSAEHRRVLDMDKVGIAVIGAGYWGPNLVRNIAINPSTDLSWVCDMQTASADRLASTFAGARATSDTSAGARRSRRARSRHRHASVHARELAIEALAAGKHVLIEKPIAAVGRRCREDDRRRRR